MVRGSTPRSRAVCVRLPLLRSSTSSTYLRWNSSFAFSSGRMRLSASGPRSRSSGASSVLSQRTSAFLMRFSSCRMLPGQGLFLMAASACGVKPCTCVPSSSAYFERSALAMMSTSSPRSRSGGQAEVDDVEAVVEVLAEARRRGSRPRGRGWSRRRCGCRPSRACCRRRGRRRAPAARAGASPGGSAAARRSRRGRACRRRPPGTCRGAIATAPVNAPFT